MPRATYFMYDRHDARQRVGPMADRRGSSTGSALGRLFLALVVPLCLTTWVAAAESTTYAINLPQQSVATALNGLSEQTGIPVAFPYDLAKDRISNPVVGRYTLTEALDALLKGTGLTGGLSEKGMLTISSAPESDQRGASVAVSSSESKGTGRTIVSRFAAIVTALSAAFAASAQESPGTPGAVALEEVIVTAQKREERLQDVPVPVTAISGEALVHQHELRLQDYYASVPSLSLISGGSGDQALAVRGISSGGANNNPSVGITVDDVPIGSSSNLSNAAFFIPDLDPSNLQSIELLRGPQGTLYGASSIGGLLKYVTVDPSTSSFSGQAQADLTSVHNGDGAGYGVRASANVPLSDSLGVLVSGSKRRDPGYIDDLIGRDGVNQVETSGGRVATLWRPTDAFSVKLAALFQNTDADGRSYADPSLGDLKQSTTAKSGVWFIRFRLYTANISAKLGGVDLASITGYSINKMSYGNDLSSNTFFTGAANQYFGVQGAFGTTESETRKFTQEIRLSSTLGKVDWLVGGFYTDERVPSRQPIYASNPTTGQVAGQLIDFSFPTTFREAAVFGDLTVHFTDRFNVQFGGRETHNHQEYNEHDTGALLEVFGYPSPADFGPTITRESSFTYLVTPQFRISPDLMTYARFASGYRPGGPNAESSFGLPEKFGADKTYNYELGIKGDVLDHDLSFDASVYYINWKDMQLSLERFGLFFLTNASSAKSQGAELSVAARPWRGMVATAWVAWNDAKLTSNIPAEAGNAVSGDALPYSSRISGNLSLNQDFFVTNNWTAFLGGSVSYVDDRKGDFVRGTAVRQSFPSYTKTDLKAGLRYESWTLTAFLNNATDQRGILKGDPSVPGSLAYIQPRTAGLSIGKIF